MSYGEVGMLSSFALSCGLAGILFAKKAATTIGQKVLPFLVTILTLVAIFLTQSRSIWLASIITIFVLLTVSILRLKRKKLSVSVLFFVGSIIVVLIIANMDNLLAILDTLTGEGRNRQNVMNRLYNFSFGFNELLLHPLGHGNGYATSILGNTIRLGEPTVIHNYFAHNIVAQGLIGLMPLLLFTVMFFRLFKIILSHDDIYYHNASKLLGCLTGSFITLNFYKGTFPEILYIIFGLTLSIDELSRIKNNE